jgi:hypothetical protein
MAADPQSQPGPADELAAHLHAAVADELRHMGTILTALAARLVDDAHFVDHYLEELQSFDLLIQCAEESAAVLERVADGVHAHEAVALIRLTGVQERLRAACARRSRAQSHAQSRQAA